jgi:DNA-binding response OmpR family regulator
MNKKILLVEDDRTMQNLLKTLLQIEGFEVVVIDEKPETDFLFVFQVEKPDIILMDVLLKYNNGIDLTLSIRSLLPDAPIKIILSSGIDYSAQSAKSGADRFLQKPYMPDTLINILKEL